MIMGKVIQFPREVLVEEKIRRSTRWVAELLDTIENSDPDSADLKQQLRAIAAPLTLERAQKDLRKALAEREMLSASDLMQHRGTTYRAQPSQNGAH
jgi:hypothetical protein